jgi:methionyl-tRNA synthetase
MTKKYYGGEVPWLRGLAQEKLNAEMGNPLEAELLGLRKSYSSCMAALDYTGAMAAVMTLCDAANRYIEDSAPWTLAKAAADEREQAYAAGTDLLSEKEPTANDRLAFVIYNVLEAIRILAVLYSPVMPATSAEVLRRLGMDDVKIGELASELVWGRLPSGNATNVGEPLFPRLDLESLEL